MPRYSWNIANVNINQSSYLLDIYVFPLYMYNAHVCVVLLKNYFIGVFNILIHGIITGMI